MHQYYIRRLYIFRLINAGTQLSQIGTFISSNFGKNYFLNNTILIHNNNSNPGFKPSVDILLSTDPTETMSLPIPQIEINTNELIDG